MNKKNLILIGAGGHAEACIELVNSTKKYNIRGIVGTRKDIKKKIILNKFKIEYSDQDLNYLSKKFSHALIALGQIKDHTIRLKIFNKLKSLQFKLPEIISPFAIISTTSSIGEGTVIMPGVVIGANVKIGKNCIINTKTILEHGSTVNDNTHIATSVTINGGTKIGANCFIGSNSTLAQEVTIKNNSFIKMCSRISK